MLSKDNDVADAVRGGWVRQMQLEGASPCPVCKHSPQLRQHVFTTTMALALIHLHHRGEPVSGASVPAVVTTGDSLKKLQLWGLVATDDLGMYRLTDEGVEAVHKRRTFARHCVGSSRVDLQACKLEYSIVSPK